MAVVERIIERKDGKKSVYIYIEIPLPNGRKLKRSFGKKGLVTKTQARLYEQELKRKIKMGQLDVVQADITTFNEFVSDFISYLKNIKKNRAWKDVDFQTNNIRIEMTNSKNKRTEFVPMNKALRKMLLEQKLKTGSSGYVFQNMALKSNSNVDYYLKLACDEAGISGLRFHDLRHTAATRMLEVGHSIQTVSKILRHSSIVTTMRYYHPDNSLREAVESLTNFGGTATNIATNDDLQKSN
ncbi:site-specific integrase [Desulfobacterota bacterium AH_259_B03_O07]|nr:site-specific integrase [Desulfobacterota bacterium AH_259_B03_O07]